MQYTPKFFVLVVITIIGIIIIASLVLLYFAIYFTPTEGVAPFTIKFPEYQGVINFPPSAEAHLDTAPPIIITNPTDLPYIIQYDFTGVTPVPSVTQDLLDPVEPVAPLGLLSLPSIPPIPQLP